MRVIDPGHKYALRHLDGDGEEIITYVKREGEKYPGNIGHHPGTNLQDEIRAQIHRVQYLEKQDPHWRNNYIIAAFRDILLNLESRAAERHNRSQLVLWDTISRSGPIETVPVCAHCGHIGCEGGCKSCR